MKKEEIEKLVGESMEDIGLEEYFDENETYDGDDPKCDQEYVARCRENWGGIWNG